MKRAKKTKNCTHRGTEILTKKSSEESCRWGSGKILWVCFHEEVCSCGANLGRSAACPSRGDQQ